jgi:protein-S-isoprenylcysteine O-methyltransferase Ste14
MSDRDRPNVVVFPPLVPIAMLVLALALQWLAPLGLLIGIGQSWRIAVGAAIAAAGVLVTARGGYALRRRGSNVSPQRPAVALATGGIYRWTRNPMYVGGLIALAGIALVFALDWLPLVMAPAALLLHFGIVRREEQYLEGKFGDEYRRYRAFVPRYLGRSLEPASLRHHQES